MEIPTVGIARSDGGFTLDQQKTGYPPKLLVISKQDEKRKRSDRFELYDISPSNERQLARVLQGIQVTRI